MTPTPAEELALDLGFLQDDDVRYVISEHLGIDLHGDEIPAEICAEVRFILSPNCERSAPARLYWQGHPAPIEPEGGSKSPTRDEGFYPEL